jgi:ABC-type multidrug transport system fused ATPase/permease subunit
VLIDGRDVGIYDAGWFRRRVALVSQEPVLYARSIKRNIKLGLEPEDGVPPEELPTDAEVEEAARLANAHDFISALPEGYDTECGERGVQLSGGQKQRIAIARALVRRPAVLLLDEATSALDADSEATVQEALDRTMAGRTVLLIAHRLSTVQNASRIVVVQGGEAVESGTHEGLLARGGAYAALVKRQLARASSSASLAGHGGGGSMIG